MNNAWVHVWNSKPFEVSLNGGCHQVQNCYDFLCMSGNFSYKSIGKTKLESMQPSYCLFIVLNVVMQLSFQRI